MDQEQFPNTQKKFKIPESISTGVLISTPVSVLHNQSFEIQGVYIIPKNKVEYFGQPLHHALTCVVWSNLFYLSFNPFINTVLFSDDEEKGDYGYRGYFNFKLNDKSLPLQRGLQYYIHVSLGEYLSNSVKILLE